MAGQTITFNLSVPEPSPPAFGADIMSLLAASSFVAPFDGTQDPRAAESFSTLCDAYCNGLNLLVPLPRDTVQKALFYDLWESRAAISHLPHVELTDEGFEAISQDAAEFFGAYAYGDSPDIARWISFQFSRPIADTFLGRADEEALRRAAPLAAKLLGGQKLEGIRSNISKLQRSQGLRAPQVYEHLQGTSAIPSFHHLCVAYALSVVLRGYSYSVALSNHPDAPLYRYHWIRSPIIRRIAQRGIAEKVSPAVNSFPWGSILLRIFDPKKPLVSRDKHKFIEVVQGLRDRSGQMRDAINQGLLNNTPDSVTTLTDAEAFVLDILREVEVVPLFADSTLRQNLIAWLRDIVAKNIPLLKVPVEVLTSNVQGNWVRSTESSVRIRFKRDRFWEFMEDPGIREALNLRKRF